MRSIRLNFEKRNILAIYVHLNLIFSKKMLSPNYEIVDRMTAINFELYQVHFKTLSCFQRFNFPTQDISFEIFNTEVAYAVI